MLQIKIQDTKCALNQSASSQGKFKIKNHLVKNIVI